MAIYNNPYNTQNFTGYYPNAYSGTYPPYAFPNPASTVQNQQTQPQSSLLTVFVNSEEEVNQYPVAAGVTVMLIGFNLGKFFLKTTGKDGVPQPVRVFSFTEETTAPAQNTNAESFVTKEEFTDLSNKLNDLITKLGGDK